MDTRRWGVATFGFLLCVGAACTSPPAPPRDTPLVVATLPPLADWCRVLLGDDADVHCLLRRGGTPHGYEPVPADARHVAQAAVIVGWGGHVDDWLEKLVSQGERRDDVVWLYTDRHAPVDEGENPHAWLDPERARQVVASLSATLEEALPDYATDITARAAAYDGELAALQARMGTAASAWRGQAVVSLHPAWTHFLSACGVSEIGSILPESGAPPSSRNVAALAQQLRGRDTRVIVVEPQLSTRTAKSLAADTDATLVVLDPLGRADVPGYDSYLGMMHSNLDALAAPLGGIPDA